MDGSDARNARRAASAGRPMQKEMQTETQADDSAIVDCVPQDAANAKGDHCGHAPHAEAAAGGGSGSGDGSGDGEGNDAGSLDSGPRGLTKNERLVWGALADADDPMKAYEILDQLKDEGVRAPMTVYRALEGLESKGFIHKLDGLNAFIPCNHEGPHPIQVFLVCNDCTGVEEVDLPGVESGLTPALRSAGFRMQTARFEVRGVCRACA